MSLKSAVAAGGSSYNGINTRRPAIGIIKLLLLGITQISHVAAAPLKEYLGIDDHGEPDAEGSSRWLMLTIAAVLVLLGGAFAGLTIALMGQDNIYLQVIATSGEGKERKNAEKVLTLLKRGKHWVLVTLLLSNVIVNETLPIVLDHSLGGGWLAVLISTAMIVIFGEVIPQSICVRWGLPIGAFMAYPVLVLMYIMSPIAWPTAKLLDRLIGEDHGTVYKKAGLKTLVTLHKTLGSSPTERLNQDEVTIITAVLELKDKSVGDIMTPIEDTFTMCEDTVLDDDTMVMILNAGYSRIPIYAVGQPGNFTGMLLVKMLITYDPEDCKMVKDFALATLPETRPETCCLDIINFFQDGKSHMILVSDTPGESNGAIGVVTLEDVIEELIGEEIIDESDVFVDVHKAIRRLAPAPKARYSKGHIIENAPEQLIDVSEDQGSPLVKKVTNGGSRAPSPAVHDNSPKTTFLKRGPTSADGRPAPMRGSHAEMFEHLKHLGPSNLASRPKTTRINTVKIKAARSSVRSDSRTDISINPGSIIEEEPYTDNPVASPALEGGEGEGLLASGGLAAKDGVQALQQGYGSFAPPSPRGIKTSDGTVEPSLIVTKTRSKTPERKVDSRQGSQGSKSSDTVGSLVSVGDGPPRRKKGTARSGSITENIIEADGIRKVILETTASSSDDLVDENTKPTNASKPSLLDTLTGWNNSTSSISKAPLPLLDGNASSTDGHENAASGEVVKKKRRRNRKKKSPKNTDEVADGSVDGSTGTGGK